MKNTKKVLLGGVAALALVGTSVFGTYMYLTSKTDTVTNTFTVGKVAITLDENDTDNSKTNVTNNHKSENKSDTRDIKNTYPKVVPGHTYAKDPTVWVEEGSEDSWIFVKVTNNLVATIEGKTVNAETTEVGKTINEQILAKGWVALDTQNNPGVYYKEWTTGSDVRLDVFDTFTLSKDLNTDNLSTVVNGKTIEVVAYAVQKDGLSSVTAAWNAVQNS